MGETPRTIFQYWFEGGAYLHLTVAGDISTSDALDMVDTLAGYKRTELTKRGSKRVMVAGDIELLTPPTTDTESTDGEG